MSEPYNKVRTLLVLKSPNMKRMIIPKFVINVRNARMIDIVQHTRRRYRKPLILDADPSQPCLRSEVRVLRWPLILFMIVGGGWGGPVLALRLT